MRKTLTGKLSKASTVAFTLLAFALLFAYGCAEQSQTTSIDDHAAPGDQVEPADSTATGQEAQAPEVSDEPITDTSATETTETAEPPADQLNTEKEEPEAAARDAEPITLDWKTDIEDAMDAAQERDANILVDIYADWCGFCTMLEEKTFSQEKVKAEMQKFVLLKVDADEDRQLAGKLGARGLPTSVVLDKTGKVIHSQGGFMPPDAYIRFLKVATQLAEQK